MVNHQHMQPYSPENSHLSGLFCSLSLCLKVCFKFQPRLRWQVHRLSWGQVRFRHKRTTSSSTRLATTDTQRRRSSHRAHINRHQHRHSCPPHLSLRTTASARPCRRRRPRSTSRRHRRRRMTAVVCCLRRTCLRRHTRRAYPTSCSQVRQITH